MLEWEERHQKGEFVSVTELCKDCPELRDELERRIQVLLQMQPTRGMSRQDPSVNDWPTQPPSGSAAPTVGGESRSPSDWPLLPGYEIVGELGEGGMGVVYKARQLSLNRLVAIKFLSGGAHVGARQLERFRAEAEAIARLQHPNIIQIIEINAHEGRPYFVLEFIEGGSLDWRLGGKPLPGREAAALVETLARAMHHVHQCGIVHRDLKPANILLAGAAPLPIEQCLPKITDFGIAKRLTADQGLTPDGFVLGTPSYMAPEQADGKTSAIGPVTDVYALGAILYETLTGKAPFQAATPLDTILRVLGEKPKPPRTINPLVEADLEAVCLKCLEKQPDQRYGSALELADDLLRCRKGEPIQARPLRPLERVRYSLRRHRAALWPIAAGLLAAGAFLLVMSFWSPGAVPKAEPAAPVYTEEQIWQAASSLRRTIIQGLLPRRQLDGWFLRSLASDASPARDQEIWAHSQAVAALLQAPETTLQEKRDLLKSVEIPFAPGQAKEKDNINFGWLAGTEKEADWTVAMPALQTQLAVIAALATPNLLTGESRERFLKRYAYTQEVLRQYRPAPFEGGWNMFPLQKDPTQTSTYATVLAVRVLLLAGRAGLPWEGSDEKRKRLLAESVRWLQQQYDASANPPGWRETSRRADPIYDGLTLEAYAVLMWAEAEAGLSLLPQLREQIPRHLERCGKRPLDYPDQTGSFPGVFRSHREDNSLRKEAMTFVWYPWAMAAGGRWLRNARQFPQPEQEAQRVRQALGYLVVDLGEQGVRASLSGWTFKAAETLLGLDRLRK